MRRGERALVLFSGGQDSTTCLAWALSKFTAVETVGFDYRQRHAVELACRDRIRAALHDALPDLARGLGEEHTIDLGVLGEVSETSLTRDVEIGTLGNGLPSTFVPGRNIIFAAAGVTDGSLLKAVRFFRDGTRTECLVMTTEPHQVRFIDTIHAESHPNVVIRF